MSHSYLGDPQTGVSYADRAIALSRSRMNRMFGYTAKTLAYLVGRDYEKAVHWGRRTVQVNENYTAVLKMLAASLVHAGRIDDARRVVRRVLSIEPDFRLSSFRYPLKRQGDMALYLEGLKKAGVHE